MFPQDRYTPHGYLDNPAHSWKGGAGPGGVLRSRPAIGMGWHFPSFPHGYNYVWYYRAFLQLGFRLPGGAWYFDPEDFKEGRLDLYSDYHSKNWLSFVFETPAGLRVRSLFYLAESQAGTGDALGCLVQIRNRAEQVQSGSFVAALDYERQLGKGLDWTSGLYTRYNQGGLSVAAYQEGTALHLRGASPATGATGLQAGSMAALVARLRGEPASHSADPGENIVRQVGGLEFEFECAPGQDHTFQLVLSRDVSEWAAVNRATRLLSGEATPLYESLSRLQLEDNSFWQNAPVLAGDWPGYVRRGLVYDFETLRMMARRPEGIYRHPWDAMQVQVPRTVLAEAALDMLILSYADPQTAKEVLLGTFADAPEPNVPCSREDGSYNMVAIDGSPCGTAPEWCFPFHCIELVYRRTLDRAWLRELYPYLEAYIRFWQEHRTDPQGRPYYKCSWEAGQDNSARFEIPEDPSGGGALGEHLWPVDLQAALTQSCWLLASWAAELELGQEKESYWNNLGGQHYNLMQQLWRPERNWFHDFDRRRQDFTSILDTMQLAPLLCRAVTPDQVNALQGQLEDPPKHGQVFHPLMWPSIVFCLVEACSEAGRSDLAARHGWSALAAVYRWMDSNPASTEADQGGLPGVGREYWPQVISPQANPPRGGGATEVYGWGCLNSYMLLRYVIGVQEERPAPGEQVAFRLCPGLPEELVGQGKIYQVNGLPCQGTKLDITYSIGENRNIEAKVAIHRAGSDSTGPVERHYTLTNNQAVRISL